MFYGQICPIFGIVDDGNELIKIVRKLGKERDLTVRIDKKRGRGSHFTLYFGNKRTIMKDRTLSIVVIQNLRRLTGPGLLKKILDNLGLKRDDIR